MRLEAEAAAKKRVAKLAPSGARCEAALPSAPSAAANGGSNGGAAPPPAPWTAPTKQQISPWRFASAASAFKSRVRLPAGLPGLMGKEPKDSNALVVLEVGVGGGKSARLPVHAGDIPAVIAAKFASEHGLPAAYQQKLVATIEQQLARVRRRAGG